MPQSLFKAGQHVDVRCRLDIDGPACRQPDLLQGGREHILAGDDPQHLATRAGSNAGAELTRRRTVQGIIPASCHFMECAQRQAATGQARIDLAHAEGQHLAASVAMPFETADCSPKLLQTGFFRGFNSHVTVWRPLCRRIS